MTDTRDPFAPFEAIAVNADWTDPAVDQTDAADDPAAPAPRQAAQAGERLRRYRETRDARELVLAGTPHRFVCRPLPASLLARYDALPPSERWVCCVLAGLHEVRRPDGPPLRPAGLDRGPAGVRLARDEWVDRLAAEYGLETVYEMGNTIDRISRLPASRRGPFC